MSDGIGQVPRRAFGVRSDVELESADDAVAEMTRRGFERVWAEDGRVWGLKETPDGMVTLTWSQVRWEPVWCAGATKARPGVGWSAEEAVIRLAGGMSEAAHAAVGAGLLTPTEGLAMIDRGRRLKAAFEEVGHD
mgnify:FL=1